MCQALLLLSEMGTSLIWIEDKSMLASPVPVLYLMYAVSKPDQDQEMLLTDEASSLTKEKA